MRNRSTRHEARTKAKVVAWVAVSAMIVTLIGTATVDVAEGIVAGIISALVQDRGRNLHKLRRSVLIDG